MGSYWSAVPGISLQSQYLVGDLWAYLVRAQCSFFCICESESSTEFLKSSSPWLLSANHSHERCGQECTRFSKVHGK